MEKAIQPLRGSGVVSRGDYLYGRNVQGQGETHLCPGRGTQGSFPPLQRQPERQGQARHRHP